MYRHILVPIDGSPLSERALRYALPLAERHGARLTLLHVAAPLLDAIAGGGAPVREPALDAAWLAEDRKAVERIAKRARKQTAVQVDVAYRSGRPAPTIADYAATEGVDLVVLCTHGRGGFSRFWLGSVADGVMRRSEAPVLLIKPGEEAPSIEREQAITRVLIPLDGSVAGEEILDQALVSYIDYVRAGFEDQSAFDRLFSPDPPTPLLEQWDLNREMTFRIAWKPYMYNPTLPPLLAGVRTPALIVHGRQDRIVPPGCAEQYARALPGSRVEIVESAGHFVDMEQPDTLAKLIVQFVAES